MRRRAALLLALAALAGCHRSRPSEVPPAQTAVEASVAAPYDLVWERALAFFAAANVPLATANRADGRLAAERLSFTPPQRLAWLTCGPAGGTSAAPQGDPAGRGLARVSVQVQPAGDSTRVRVRLAVEGRPRRNVFAEDQYASEVCVSTGVLEQRLLAAVQLGGQRSRGCALTGRCSRRRVAHQVGRSPTPASDASFRCACRFGAPQLTSGVSPRHTFTHG